VSSIKGTNRISSQYGKIWRGKQGMLPALFPETH
jgi:hypothetical protein